MTVNVNVEAFPTECDKYFIVVPTTREEEPLVRLGHDDIMSQPCKLSDKKPPKMRRE
jgi:hypothetical protein